MATKHWHDTSRDRYLNTNRGSDHVEVSNILDQADDREKLIFAYQEIAADKARQKTTKLQDALSVAEVKVEKTPKTSGLKSYNIFAEIARRALAVGLVAKVESKSTKTPGRGGPGRNGPQGG